MNSTIQTPVSERAPTEESLTIWSQREVIPFMLNVRKSLNYEYMTAVTYQSANLGYETAWTSDDIPTDRSWNLKADIVATSTSGAAQSAAFYMMALFQNASGTVAQIGTTIAHNNLSSVSIDARLAVLGNAVIVQVKDDGVSPMTWKVRTRALSTDEV